MDEHKHVPWGGGEAGAGGKGRGRERKREHCTVPDQLVVDKELEFRVEVGKTDTEGGPVVGREHREEVVDRRTVSTTTQARNRQRVKGVTQTWVWKQITHNVRGGKTLKTQRDVTGEKGREKSDMSNVVLLHPWCQSVRFLLDYFEMFWETFWGVGWGQTCSWRG